MPFPSRTLFCAERIQTNFKLGSTTACVGNVQTKHGANAGVSEACQSLGNLLKLETLTAQASLGEMIDRPKDGALRKGPPNPSFFNILPLFLRV
jgi:hypothetical protein